VADTNVAAPAAAASSLTATSHESRLPKSKTYGKTAKIGALWGIGRESVTQLLGIPTVVILARLLSPTDFGIAAAASLFIQFGKRLGNLGLNTALVRIKDIREEHRASVFVLNCAFGVIACVGLLISADGIARLYGDERVAATIRVGSTIFLVTVFGTVQSAILQRDLKFKQIAFVEWTYPMVSMPVSVGMALAGWGYWSLVWGQVAATVATTASKMYFGRWTPSLKATRRGFSETVPFALGIYAKRLLTYAAESLDSLIVGSLFGVTWLGFYDKAFNVADNLANRMAIGTNVLFRIFSIIQDDGARFKRAYAKAQLAGTIVTIPVFAGLIVAAPQFITVVFGDKWMPAVVPFQLLCASGALRRVTAFASAAVQASGRIWGEVWRKIAQVGLIVGLVFAFRGWGIEGAAFGVLLSSIILAVLMQGLVRQIFVLTWRELSIPLLPSSIAAAATAGAIWLVTIVAQRLNPDTDAYIVLSIQAVSGAVTWLVFVLYGRFGALQEVVDEVMDEVVPRPMGRLIDRVRPRAAQDTRTGIK
jgi:O-antigen/teichoic acid export membrane protein